MNSSYFNFFPLLALLLVFAGRPVLAEIVTQPVAPGINAKADYLHGDDDRPLLVFMHGFLQTYHFTTVKRLSEALNEDGYSTLSPNLSLGINERVQSLPCEAIHLHSLSDAAQELNYWIDWAINQGHDDIILIGHSAGSIAITAYLYQGSQHQVNKTILISLTHFGPDQPASFETQVLAEKARAVPASRRDELAPYALSFCEKYVTTAENYLSYYDWSSEQVLRALKRSWTDNYIILGSSDQRISDIWTESLQLARGRIIMIDGANHFFDQAHEFDLLETVELILDNDS